MIKAYECFLTYAHPGYLKRQRVEWSGSVIFAMSPGKAKSTYLRDVSDSWPDVSFKTIGCKVLNKPPSDERFMSTARYRGVPFARIGMAVEVGGDKGLIVGKNSSANFNVLFLDGKHAGLTLNCHPNWKMRYFGEDGALLHDTEQKLATAEQDGAAC